MYRHLDSRRITLGLYVFLIAGRRNGRQANEKMQEVLKRTIEDARGMTSKVNAI